MHCVWKVDWVEMVYIYHMYEMQNHEVFGHKVIETRIKAWIQVHHSILSYMPFFVKSADEPIQENALTFTGEKVGKTEQKRRHWDKVSQIYRLVKTSGKIIAKKSNTINLMLQLLLGSLDQIHWEMILGLSICVSTDFKLACNLICIWYTALLFSMPLAWVKHFQHLYVTSLRTFRL